MSRVWRSATSRSRAAAPRLARDERGVSAVEFALLLPMLVMLSFGIFEASRLITLNHKLQNGSFILGDLVARDRTISEDEITNIFIAIESIIEPFDFDVGGTVILTSVGAAVDDEPVVNWQRVGAGALESESAVGEPGEPAALPDGLPISAGETIITAEVVFAYAPFFGLVLDPQTIRKISYYKPRLGTLETVLP